MHELRKGIPWNKKERPSKEFLEEEYTHKNKPIVQLARQLNIGATTLRRWLVDYEIKIRGHIKHAKLIKPPTKELLNKWYNIESLSKDAIAKKLGASPPYIDYLLRKFDLGKIEIDEKMRIRTTWSSI